MPILSPKRQVTLPKELCDRLRVQPGDDLDILEYQGRITILKRVKGASAGVLGKTRVDRRYSDAESLADTLRKRRQTP
jgi:AbrB family looped-hinge helix DNA binding protein